jgi:AAA15 family ATPase/GTPase
LHEKLNAFFFSWLHYEIIAKRKTLNKTNRVMSDQNIAKKNRNKISRKSKQTQNGIHIFDNYHRSQTRKYEVNIRKLKAAIHIIAT